MTHPDLRDFHRSVLAIFPLRPAYIEQLKLAHKRQLRQKLPAASVFAVAARTLASRRKLRGLDEGRTSFPKPPLKKPKSDDEIEIDLPPKDVFDEENYSQYAAFLDSEKEKAAPSE